MLIGNGIDIVYIPRIENIWQKYKEKFLARVYNEQEIIDSHKYSDYRMQVRHFAKRFAAKEAFVKALGIGFRGINIKDIEISNDKNGRPNITIRNSIPNLLSKNDIIKVSLSDDGDYAIAYVIILQSKEITA
ncbi:holo-[acyl-carrier-protein] synthase [Candidatus Mesenet endosymbiont of Agriotes lineatus]|uniref:holo-[acyl-carrier-protein] synthase n=1 Tax=Candidatus Mesenet endosymbiont of Agriotes lineatus TaxID=3077948 RepID=UPI0030CCEDC2